MSKTWEENWPSLSSSVNSSSYTKTTESIRGQVRKILVVCDKASKKALVMTAVKKEVEEGSSSDEQVTRADSDTELPSSGASETSDECSTSLRHSEQSESTPAVNNKVLVPCSYYGKGSCTKGDSCRFVHGDQELQKAISDVGTHRHRVAKTQLCTFFARSRCLFGAHCFFAHGEAELRKPVLSGRHQATGRAKQTRCSRNSAPPSSRPQLTPQGHPSPPSILPPPPPLVGASQVPAAPAPPSPSPKLLDAASDLESTSLTMELHETKVLDDDNSDWQIAINEWSAETESPDLTPKAVEGLKQLILSYELPEQQSLSQEHKDENEIDENALYSSSAKPGINEHENEDELWAAMPWWPSSIIREKQDEDSIAEEEDYSFASLTSAKVHRWDEALGRWVEDVLDIEEYIPPHHGYHVDSQRGVAVPSIDSAKTLVLALALAPPAASPLRADGTESTILGSSLGRTPLRRSAAQFVPWGQQKAKPQ